MSTIRTFRALAAASVFSLIVSVVQAYITVDTTKSAALSGYLTGSGYGALMSSTSLLYLWWLWIMVYLIAHGLAFSLNWFARPFFILAFALILIQNLFGGLMVGEPLNNSLWSIHSFINLFLVGMLFFSPAVDIEIKKGGTKNG